MFYAHDLARIHDAGFGDFARAAAAELLTRIDPPGRIVELGCGTGISSALCAAAGFEVFGIDASEAMLELARERVPDGTFVQGSVWETELQSCRAVTALGEVLNYADAGSGDLRALLARVHAALEPGGLFLFDVATPGRGTDTAVLDGEGWTIRSETVEDGARLTRRIAFTADGRSGEETHTLHLYERDAVAAALADAGFAVDVLDCYADFKFWPGYAGFAAVS